MNIVPEQFLRVECSECGNEQIIFSHAADEVECLVCNEPLALPSSGKAEISSKVIEELSPE